MASGVSAGVSPGSWLPPIRTWNWWPSTPGPTSPGIFISLNMIRSTAGSRAPWPPMGKTSSLTTGKCGSPGSWTRKAFPGRSWGWISSWNPPAPFGTGLPMKGTSGPGRKESSWGPPGKSSTPPWSMGSTTGTSIRPATGSSPTPPAPPTVWRRWSKCCMTPSASSTA